MFSWLPGRSSQHICAGWVNGCCTPAPAGWSRKLGHTPPTVRWLSSPWKEKWPDVQIWFLDSGYLEDWWPGGEGRGVRKEHSEWWQKVKIPCLAEICQLEDTHFSGSPQETKWPLVWQKTAFSCRCSELPWTPCTSVPAATMGILCKTNDMDSLEPSPVWLQPLLGPNLPT